MTAACTLSVLLCLAAPAPAQRWTPLFLNGGSETGAVVARNGDGDVRWTSTWTMREDSSEAGPVIVMREDGEGIYTGFEGRVRWRTDTLWTGQQTIRPLEAVKTFSDPAGSPLVRERTEFDQDDAAIRFEREDLRSGKKTSRTFEMPEDTLSVEGLAAALRTMKFEKGPPVRAHLFTPEPQLYEVRLEFRGRERVRVDGTETEADKIEVVPRLGVLGLFRFLLPKAYFWFAADRSRTWIRYEGPESGRGSPTITMERAE